MNAKLATVLAGVSSLATCTLLAGPFIVVNPPSVVISPPVVTVPAPAVTVSVGVPDTYVWDGTEYVGYVGDQGYYLGPGHVWLAMDGPRLARFHDWARIHADWRDHAIRNMDYRRDAHGHDYPRGDLHGAPNHDYGHDGHDYDHHDH